MAIHSFVQKVETDVTSSVSFLHQFLAFPSGYFCHVIIFPFSLFFSLELVDVQILFVHIFNTMRLQKFCEKGLILLKSAMAFSAAPV